MPRNYYTEVPTMMPEPDSDESFDITPAEEEITMAPEDTNEGVLEDQ